MISPYKKSNSKYCSEKCSKNSAYLRNYFIKPGRERVRVLRGTGEKDGGFCLNCKNKNPTYRGIKPVKYCSKKCMDEYRYKSQCKICGNDRNIQDHNCLCVQCGVAYRKLYKWKILKGENFTKLEKEELTRAIRILSIKRKEVYESTSNSERNKIGSFAGSCKIINRNSK